MSHTENGNQKIMIAKTDQTAALMREKRIEDFAMSLTKSTFGTPLHRDYGYQVDWLARFSNETAERFVDAFDTECRRREAAIIAKYESQESH